MRTRLICLLAAWVGLCGCGATRRPNEGPPIAIGAVYNFSGEQAVLDVPSSYGSELAAAEINASGGVLGRDVTLMAARCDSSPGSIAQQTDALLTRDPSVVALVGLSDTDMVLAAAPVLARHERVLVTSGATSPKLPGQVPDFLYLACFGDNVQAAAGAEWAYGSLGARKVEVLYDPDESYPRLLQGYFARRFEELGGTISGQREIQPRAKEVGLPNIGDVDLVFLSLETADDAARVVPMLRANGYAGPILGGDGYDAESVWAVHPEIGNVYFTTHAYMGADSPNPRMASFLLAYRKAHPGQEPSSFAALGYDAVGLVAAAIRRSGEATPAGVRAGLAGLTGYAGVTGTISFEGTDRIPRKTVTLLQVTDGRLAHVAQVMPRSVPKP